jgi:hippurate hydrolase
MDARAAIAPFAGDIVAIRHDLHAHPEIGLEEKRTSALVASLLAAWGWQVETGLGGTGVVGTLSRGTGRRSIGLRADMDALPIPEETGLPYASRIPGVMHACGHDGHTAMLLAAARALASSRTFDGTVHLIFQPAEENHGGGRLMMEDGLFSRFPCDAVFGLHVMPGMAENTFATRPGPFMASVEEARITVRGTGGHGALPHLTADPVVAASSLVLALQTVVSRNIDPLEAGIVTVGAFRAGTVCNVIPERAELLAGLRAFSPQVCETIRARVSALAHAQAESFGCSADVVFSDFYPVLVNHPAMTDVALSAAAALLGPEAVGVAERPYPFGEDFAFMLQEVPGCYGVLGQGSGRHALHHPRFDFNDATLVTGGAYWVTLAERFLAVA